MADCHAHWNGGAGANRARNAQTDRTGGTTMTRTMTDENLVARTLAGDRNAFRALAETRYQSVYRLCRSILRHPEDAEDATQEVFVRAYQALGQFAGARRIRRMAAPPDRQPLPEPDADGGGENVGAFLFAGFDGGHSPRVAGLRPGGAVPSGGKPGESAGAAGPAAGSGAGRAVSAPARRLLI